MMLTFRLPEKKTTSTDVDGRRYGDYFWLQLFIGRWHIAISPAHIRGITCASKEDHRKVKAFKKELRKLSKR